MKILISAYACETGRGGEGEIGWRLVHHLAKTHDVWVITRANLRTVHEAAFTENPKPDRLHFIYFDLPWIFRFYKRGKRFFLAYYYLWQLGVGLLARRLMLAQQFDVLHHLIGGMDWMPAGLALCPGPLVWGPVGSENTHPVMFHLLPLGPQIKDRARLAARWWMRNLDPFVRLTGARASAVLTHTIETMPRRYMKKMQPFVQTGIENLPTLARPKTDLARGEVLGIVFAGELKDWKGARLALDATLKFFQREQHATLTVVGDGPLRATMEAIAHSHSHGQRVHFVGQIPMPELINILHESDIFLYPSFHHGMATVVLQAMLTGLPVVCIEGDAIARTVGQEAGISVPLVRDHDPAIDVAAAILRLARDEEQRQRLASSARKIALETHSYDSMSMRLEQVLSELVNQDNPRPKKDLCR